MSLFPEIPGYIRSYDYRDGDSFIFEIFKHFFKNFKIFLIFFKKSKNLKIFKLI